MVLILVTSAAKVRFLSSVLNSCIQMIPKVVLVGRVNNAFIHCNNSITQEITKFSVYFLTSYKP